MLERAGDGCGDIIGLPRVIWQHHDRQHHDRHHHDGEHHPDGQHRAGAAVHIDVCSALPAAAASQITGTTFTKTKSSSVEGVVFGCDYDGPNSALLQITVDTQLGKLGLANDVSALKTVGHPPRPVSGVGDEAFSEPNPQGNAGAIGASAAASYGAVFGSTYIKIGGLTYVTAAQGKQIVEELHSKL